MPSFGASNVFDLVKFNYVVCTTAYMRLVCMLILYRCLRLVYMWGQRLRRHLDVQAVELLGERHLAREGRSILKRINILRWMTSISIYAAGTIQVYFECTVHCCRATHPASPAPPLIVLHARPATRRPLEIATTCLAHVSRVDGPDGAPRAGRHLGSM